MTTEKIPLFKQRLDKKKKQPEQKPKPATWARRARDSNWLLTFELTAIVIAVAGFIFTGIEIREANIERQEASLERIVGLYNIATAPAARKTALAFLVSRQQSLAGIDLSCQTIGIVKTNEQGKEECIEGADLTGAKLQGADLWAAKLQGANLWYAKLQGANLRLAELKSAYLEEANLQDANLRNAELQVANLTDADFTDTKIDDADFTDAWAWSDYPPKGLEEAKIDLCVYDKDKHDGIIKPNPCIAPKGTTNPQIP